MKPPSELWDKGGLDYLRDERRKNQSQSIGDVLRPLIKEMEAKVQDYPDRAPMTKEWTLEERIGYLKIDFHHQANRLAKEPYIYHLEVVPILNQLINYYVGEECGLDLNKGILLLGVPGCGKSIIMEAFSNVLRQGETRPGGFRYRENRLGALFVEAKGLCREYGTIQSKEGKELYWQTYGSNLSAKEAKQQEHFPANHLTIDDLYKEEIEKARVYGENPVIEILNMRVKLMRYGIMTNGTANYEIHTMEKYGEPAIDRLREMCNIIEFTNDSFR